jgi:hypothetical protein
MEVEITETESEKVVKEKSFELEAAVNTSFRGHCNRSKNTSITGFWEVGQEECMEDELVTAGLSIGVGFRDAEIDQKPRQV